MDTIGLPARPVHLSVYAQACLQALAQQGWGEHLSKEVFLNALPL